MSCIYKDSSNIFFDKVSIYGIENPSNIKRKISIIAENISKEFEQGNYVKNHLILTENPYAGKGLSPEQP